MIALDTNLLVYAHRRDSEWHEPAAAIVVSLAEGAASWALPWPCLHEFIAIATHPRIYDPPTPVADAIAQVDAWLESPSALVLSERSDYWSLAKEVFATGRVKGPLVHDARVVALCRSHGVREPWSADRDFTRFPGLHVRNPLLRPST